MFAFKNASKNDEFFSDDFEIDGCIFDVSCQPNVEQKRFILWIRIKKLSSNLMPYCNIIYSWKCDEINYSENRFVKSIKNGWGSKTILTESLSPDLFKNIDSWTFLLRLHAVM